MLAYVIFFSYLCTRKINVSMFDNLSERLERSFKILKGEGRITEINIAETVKDIRKALLEADVNYKTAKQFTDQVKEKALGQNVMTSVRPGQLMVKITHDELAALMGGEVACDVYRPAAIEQLRVLGEQINAKVFSGENLSPALSSREGEQKDPVKIAQAAIAEAKRLGYDVVIVDTAGRLAVDEQMMNEIAAIKEAITPSETLFVVDAMTGQDAVNTAKEFNDRLDFDGVVLTKLDGDARGGAALSIRSVVNKPIKFIGTGEKMEALDVFHPARMADRILGMGDVVSLVERAQEQYDEAEARRISKKIAKNQFDFNDFIGQLNQIKKMGSMKDLMSMIPGMDKALKGVEVSDDAFKPIEAMINSMTPAERANPGLLNGSRKNRIAKGAGVTIVELNRFLKQFEQTSKMMRKVQQMSFKRR